MLLFNFQEFISEMREQEDKKTLIEQYEAVFWPIQWDIVDQIWYRDYIAKFDPIEYVTPEEMENDFDWELLQRLIVGSFASEYALSKNPETGLSELTISIKNGDQSITKMISELWSFQILRLFEIYVEDQMSMALVYQEEEQAIKEGTQASNSIQDEREIKLKKRNLIHQERARLELAAQTKVSQEAELNDLMNML